jgi:hypothetical protein
VLIPGGFALLAFQVGDEPLVLDVRPYAHLVRERADGTHESTKQAYLVVRKPGTPA